MWPSRRKIQPLFKRLTFAFGGIASFENELYPGWQVGQYLQSMFRTHHDTRDNDRYPDLKWTSLADLVAHGS
jgi:hypothetical protein